MDYSIILFAILFVITALIHKPLNAHESKNWLIQKAHFRLEHMVIIQALIVANELLKALK